MRITKALLPVSLTIIATTSACWPQKQMITRPALTASTQVAPASTIRPVDRIFVTNYQDMGTAVEAIFSFSPDLKAISFGEIHKDTASNLVSSMHYFAISVLPVLAKHGIKDIAWEFLPYSEKAASEVAEFNRSSKLGPFLSKQWAFNEDYCELLKMLEQARSLGVSLYGINPSGSAEQSLNTSNQAELISKKTIEIAHRLLDAGKKVATYTGAQHNNLTPLNEEETDWSFGSDLRTYTHGKYVEVDIYVPELINEYDEDRIALSDWKKYVPKTGVNLAAFPGGRYVLMLPLSAEPIVEKIPERSPNCAK